MMLYRLRVFASACLMRLGAAATFAAVRLQPESIGKQITLSPSVTVEITGKRTYDLRVDIAATSKLLPMLPRNPT